MSLLDFLQNNWTELLVLTREHILLVFLSTGFAIFIGLPLGILLTRVGSLRTPVLGFANIMQTVPSLALFGLLIPIPFIGGIGARTAIIALALYALLPVIRNTLTGILGIDTRVTEAATAMGMTGWQRLRMVELPLAMPVMLTGIRVAVVISVGVATVAAAVGAGGLGTYIFRGLRQNDNNLLVAGALAAAILALLCDVALGQFEKAYAVADRPARHHKIAAVCLSALLAVIGLSGFMPGFMPGVGATKSGYSEKVVVASKDFTESVILAEILAQMLERDGIQVERQFELGGNLPHDSLIAGRADVYPEYTGTAFTAILNHPPLTDPQAVYEQTKREYLEKFGLLISPPIGFANDFAILVRGEVAREHGLQTISDAVPLARQWTAGFGQDFMSRADGYPGFVRAYNLTFAGQPREMDLSLTYRALRAGEVDIIAGNSTDGLIGALDLVQLEDDRRYFPPYQAVYIARSDKEELLKPVFEKLSDSISTEEMRRLNHEVDGAKRLPRDVAAEYVRRE